MVRDFIAVLPNSKAHFSMQPIRPPVVLNTRNVKFIEIIHTVSRKNGWVSVTFGEQVGLRVRSYCRDQCKILSRRVCKLTYSSLSPGLPRGSRSLAWKRRGLKNVQK